MDSCIAWIYPRPPRPLPFHVSGPSQGTGCMNYSGSFFLSTCLDPEALIAFKIRWAWVTEDALRSHPGVLQQWMNIRWWNTDPQSGQSEAGVGPVFRLAEKRRLLIGCRGGGRKRKPQWWPREREAAGEQQENGRLPSRGSRHRAAEATAEQGKLLVMG